MKIISVKNNIFLAALCVVTACLFLIFVLRVPSNDRNFNYDVKLVSAKNDKIEFSENNQPIKKQSALSNAMQKDHNLENSTELREVENSVNDKNIHQYLAKFSSEIMMAVDLQEKFDADEMDSVAASEAEKELAYVFYQGMEWQDFSPQDISCKKNSCRVKLAATTYDKKTRLVELISDQMSEKNINFSYAIPVSLPVEGNELIYFIRKNSLIRYTGVLP